MWPNENDPDAQSLMGKAESVLKNAVSEAKKTLGQAFTNPETIKKTIGAASMLKDGGAKALLPMLKQGAETQLTNQIASFVPKALGQNSKGQSIANGVQGIVASNSLEPINNPLRLKASNTSGQSTTLINSNPMNAMNLTFK